MPFSPYDCHSSISPSNHTSTVLWPVPFCLYNSSSVLPSAFCKTKIQLTPYSWNSPSRCKPDRCLYLHSGPAYPPNPWYDRPPAWTAPTLLPIFTGSFPPPPTPLQGCARWRQRPVASQLQNPNLRLDSNVTSSRKFLWLPLPMKLFLFLGHYSVWRSTYHCTGYISHWSPELRLNISQRQDTTFYFFINLNLQQYLQTNISTLISRLVSHHPLLTTASSENQNPK